MNMNVKKNVMVIAIILIMILLLISGYVIYCIIFDNTSKEKEPNTLSGQLLIDRQTEKINQMYVAIIDDIMSKDSALNSQAKYIALDSNSFRRPKTTKSQQDEEEYPSITEDTKNFLVEYCKKYHPTIMCASFQELKQQGLFNEETYSLEGILLYVQKIEKLTENKAILTLAKYRSGLGAIFPEYELTYKDGQWEVKVLSMAIS